jgi:hypothetical protein
VLDAAHSERDSAGGEPVIPNGLSLCQIHHAAFDVGVLGVEPDALKVHVRPDILAEIDGPMLRHGLQALNGEVIWTPRSVQHRPDPELLRWKWERFQRAGGRGVRSVRAGGAREAGGNSAESNGMSRTARPSRKPTGKTALAAEQGSAASTSARGGTARGAGG